MANVINVLDKTRKGGTEVLVELDDPKRTKVWRPTDSVKDISPSAGSAPTFGFETPASNISQTARHLPDFTLALQQAMDEAGKHRQANLLGMSIAGTTQGKAIGPNTVPGIVNMVRSSVGPAVEQVFGGAVGAVSASIKAEQEERNFQLRLREQNLGILSDLARDGVLLNTPNTVLEKLAASAGLESSVALSWKARLAEVDKLDKEDRELEREKTEAEIQNTLDQIRKRGSDTGSQQLSVDDANLIDLAYDNLTEDDIETLNALNSDLKKDWLINKGRKIKNQPAAGVIPAGTGVADVIVNAGLGFLFGAGVPSSSPPISQHDLPDDIDDF